MNRFVVCDPARCIGCGACRVTCSESHRKRCDAPRRAPVAGEDPRRDGCRDVPPVRRRAVHGRVSRSGHLAGARSRAHRRGTLHRLPFVRAGLPVRRRVPVGALRPRRPRPRRTAVRRPRARRACCGRRRRARYASVVVVRPVREGAPAGRGASRSCPTKALALVDEGTLEAPGAQSRRHRGRRAGRGAALRGAPAAERSASARRVRSVRGGQGRLTAPPQKPPRASTLVSDGGRTRRGTRPGRGNRAWPEGKPRHDFGRRHRVRRLRGGLRRARHPHLRGRGRRACWCGRSTCPTARWCGRCAPACPTGAMGRRRGSRDFADEPEPPKRCLFALARVRQRAGATTPRTRRSEYANALLEQAGARRRRPRPRCSRPSAPTASARRDAQGGRPPLRPGEALTHLLKHAFRLSS